MTQTAMDQYVKNPEVYPPVTDELLASIVQRVRSLGSPLKIVLFGSRARGDYKADSDIDILIVEEFDREIDEKRRAYTNILRELYPEQTILVRPLKEIEQWKFVPRYITTEALREGRVLYEDQERILGLIRSEDGSFRVAEETGEYRTPEDLARWWFERANTDIRACRILIDHEEAYEDACFLAQQAAEKYLKGFLAYNDKPIKKIHSLETLIRECQEIKLFPEFSQLDLGKFSDYAIEARYSRHFHPDKDVAEDAYTKACRVREIMLAHAPPDILNHEK